MSGPLQVDDPVTARLLDLADLANGMQVLELGCGQGVVSRMLAERVGPIGSVVCVDTNFQAITMANENCRDCRNIRFIESDLMALDLNSLPEFDAIVGRRVLMYVSAWRELLGSLQSKLKPGGVFAFQERSGQMTPARIGDWPVHDLWHSRVLKSVGREGADLDLGLKLPSVLKRLGYEILSVEAHGVVAGYEVGTHSFGNLVELMVPRMVEAGVITQSDFDSSRLRQELLAEREANESIYIADVAHLVVAKKPTGSN